MTPETEAVSTAKRKTQYKFPISENAQQVINKRYSLKNEKGEPLEEWSDIVHRVVSFVAGAETNEYDRVAFVNNLTPIMKERLFLPNTPCLVNAGKPNAQLAGCHVLPIEDSIKGIMKTATDAAIIHQSGGGTGFTFERIRPAGSLVKTTHGIASGPLSFMKIFDTVTEVIKQGGVRRGANMATMVVSHPEILRFIHAKNDQTSFTNFNMSVGITDEFMDAVHNKEWFQTKFEGKDWNTEVIDPLTQKRYELVGEHVVGENFAPKPGMLYAPDVWQRIIKSAHKYAEPGIQFIDEVNRKNLLKSLGEIKTSNPCQPDFATLLTEDGIRYLKDINVGDIIWSKEGWTKVTAKKSSGIKPVYAYNTTANEFIGTEEHRVVFQGEKIEVGQSEGIDRIVGNFSTRYSHKINDLFPEQIMDGLILGDGFPHKASNNKIVLLIGADDQDYFSSEVANLILGKSGISDFAYTVVTGLQADELPRVWDRRIPERFFEADCITICSLLRGVYSANGSVCGNRITLKSTSLGLIKDVRLLLNSVGIGSYYTTNKPTIIEHRNGVYESKQSYDLNITADRDRFLQMIGFIQRYKTENVKITTTRITKSFNIKSIEYLGDFEVFHITVDNQSHTYWTGGCNVSNCSEQFLHDYNSCNLGSIDVSKFYKRDWNGSVARTGKDSPAANFDWENFSETIYWCIRFLDNVIDVCSWPLPEIDDTVKRTRPVGLGLMGFADLLIKLKVRYGSEESIQFLSELMVNFQHDAWKASCLIGKEKGAFPEYVNNKESYGSFLWDEIGLDDLLLDNLDETIADAKTGNFHGAHFYPRNYEVTTIAPTGTISLVADTTSGIEPNFAWTFTRSDTVSTRNYIHPLVMQTLGIDQHDPHAGIIITTAKLPDYFVTAHELSAQEHLMILATTQKFIDNGVSKTCNGQASDSVEDVRHLYEEAYKLNVKSVSYYRDGSRNGQVIVSSTLCPECQTVLNGAGKCLTCSKCGWSTCNL